jgi:hypothetical protein
MRPLARTGRCAIDLANSLLAEEGGTVSENSSASQQASFLRWTKTSRKGCTDPVGARSSDKFVVSVAGEAYHATENQLNWKFRFKNFKFYSGLDVLPPQNDLHSGVHFHKLPVIMKNQITILSLVALTIALFSFEPLASAHERDTFKVGDKYYLLIVGSLNEPFIVDNISGVDLRVSRVPGPGGNGASEATGNGTPVTGLERTLKVELAAGDKKETLPLDPSDKTPGSYAANFIPTVQTTYSYRIFGTIDNNSVDLTFTCVTGEVSESAEDNSPVKVSGSITRLRKIGAFGCPASKRTMGFPEPSLSSYELNQSVQSLLAGNEAAGTKAATAQALSIAGIVCGLLGLAVAAIALKRK